MYFNFISSIHALAKQGFSLGFNEMPQTKTHQINSIQFSSRVLPNNFHELAIFGLKHTLGESLSSFCLISESVSKITRL